MAYPARPRKTVALLLWGVALAAATAVPARAQMAYPPVPPAGPGCPNPYSTLPYPCPHPLPVVPPQAAPPAAQPPARPPAAGEQRRPEEAARPEERPQGEQAPQEQQQPEANAPSAETGQGLAGAGGEVASTSNFVGDFLGLPIRLAAVPGVPSGSALPGTFRAQFPVAAFVTRTFKVGEDENPRPQDRVFVDFNFYDDVSHEFNERFQTGLHDIQVYRETFGVEKTFCDGATSVELRVPLNSAHVGSDIPGLSPSNTDIGDLTVVTKWAPWIDRETGTVGSVGLAVTAPTGPSHFANSPVFPDVHETILTPFAGGVWKQGRWYAQAFISIDVPTSERDVTILHTDVHVGYYLLDRQRDPCACLRDLVTLFEVHVNDPLNHRGVFTLTDPVGSDDSVNLTGGLHFDFRSGASLSTGVAVPVTGPKPFEIEALVQLNYHFGAAGAGRSATPTSLGY